VLFNLSREKEKYLKKRKKESIYIRAQKTVEKGTRNRRGRAKGE